MRGQSSVGVLLAVAAVLFVLYSVFGRVTPSDDVSWVVGRWKSSRSETPIHIFRNGEWEIRRGEDEVLQYGLWRYDRDRLIWTFKDGPKYRDDINPVLSVGRDRFQLREVDGSVTTFVRIGDVESSVPQRTSK